MRKVLSLVVLLAAAGVEAKDNAAEQTKAKKDVQALLARYSGAEKAGDAITIGQCYASDGMLLPSSGDPVRGREDVTKRYTAILAGKTPRLPLESEEVWVMDDWAVSRGVTRAAPTRRNTKGAVRNRYVMTLKRRGDTWEIQSLVWNAATVR